MNVVKIVLIIVLIILLLLTVLILSAQERILFHPEKIDPNHIFLFENEFEEYWIEVDKDVKVHGLLFKSENSKGLVFYLHGNAGSLNGWAEIAPVYLDNNYDFFILDYRGFGKSQGKIKNEKQLYKDNHIVFDTLLRAYNEKKTVIIGYSIGTGMAAELASHYNPKMLILKAPYYNMTDLAHHYFKWLPGFFIRYKLKTDQYLPKIKCPIVIFHGDRDEVIYYQSSFKLSELFKEEDELIILKGQSHNGINENVEYKMELKRILEE